MTSTHVTAVGSVQSTRTAVVSDPIPPPKKTGLEQQRGSEPVSIAPVRSQVSSAPAAVTASQRTNPSSPAFGRAGAEPWQTFFITPKTDDEQRFAMIPREPFEALQKRYPDAIKKLEPGDGANIFAADAIYKVRPALVGKLISACGSTCTMTSIAQLTRPPKWTGPFDADTVIDTLENGTQVERFSLVAALQNRGPQFANPDQKTKLLYAIANVAATASTLYAATVHDVTWKRARELQQDIDAKTADVPGGIGKAFSNYAEANAAARNELAAAGGTPETRAFAKTLLACAKAFEHIPGSGYGMLDQMLDQAGGLVFDSIPASVATALVSEWESRRARALTTMCENVGHGGASGGREYLSSRYDTLSDSNPWDQIEYPFNEIPKKALMFLGSRDPTVVRAAKEAITRTVLAADNALPDVQAKHREQHIAESLEHVPAQFREKYEAQLREQYAESYERNRLTGFKEVTFMLTGFMYGARFDAKSYSAEANVVAKADLIVDLLSQVQSRDLKEDLINAGIGFYILSTQDDETFATPETKAAVQRVLAAVTGPNAPADVAKRAGAVLAGKGAQQFFPQVLANLASADDELQRDAMNVIECYVTVANGTLAGLNNPYGFRNLTEAQKAQMRAGVASAIPRLREIAATGDSVWARTDAARLLAKLGAPDLGSIITYLSALASPLSMDLKFAADRPGSKNYAVRQKALETLALCGKAAEATRPLLQSLVAEGAKAKIVQAELQKCGEGKGYSWKADADSEARETALAFLHTVARPDTRAEAAIAYTESMPPEEIAKLSSFSTDTMPLASTVISEMVIVGDAAAKALDVLDGKAKAEA